MITATFTPDELRFLKQQQDKYRRYIQKRRLLKQIAKALQHR